MDRALHEGVEAITAKIGLAVDFEPAFTIRRSPSISAASNAVRRAAETLRLYAREHRLRRRGTTLLHRPHRADLDDLHSPASTASATRPRTSSRNGRPPRQRSHACRAGKSRNRIVTMAISALPMIRIISVAHSTSRSSSARWKSVSIFQPAPLSFGHGRGQGPTTPIRINRVLELDAGSSADFLDGLDATAAAARGTGRTPATASTTLLPGTPRAVRCAAG